MEIEHEGVKKHPWQPELEKFIHQLGVVYCLNDKDILGWLTATLCGQFALCNLDEEFVRKTLDRMFDQYKKIKKRLDQEIPSQ